LKAAADRLFAPATTPQATPIAFDRVFFVNNAGSLGPLMPVGANPDSVACLAEMAAAFEFNITSSSYLTAELARRHTAGLLNADKVVVVNVSSLAAVQVRRCGD
jgi:hypothetical protein